MDGKTVSDLVVLLPDQRAELAINRLKLLQAAADRGFSHLEADNVLCELLIDLNFGDVVDEWQKVAKVY